MKKILRVYNLEQSDEHYLIVKEVNNKPSETFYLSDFDEKHQTDGRLSVNLYDVSGKLFKTIKDVDGIYKG